jgi:hypothetical protein
METRTDQLSETAPVSEISPRVVIFKTTLFFIWTTPRAIFNNWSYWQGQKNYTSINTKK